MALDKAHVKMTPAGKSFMETEMIVLGIWIVIFRFLVSGLLSLSLVSWVQWIWDFGDFAQCKELEVWRGAVSMVFSSRSWDSGRWNRQLERAPQGNTFLGASRNTRAAPTVWCSSLCLKALTFCSANDEFSSLSSQHRDEAKNAREERTRSNFQSLQGPWDGFWTKSHCCHPAGCLCFWSSHWPINEFHKS